MSSVPFGKYRLIAELGHGGMADVFLAVQGGPVGSGFRKLIVVKRLRATLLEEPEFIAMLVDEGRIAGRLNHPNVVQTNEVGSVDSQYFLAMEFLDGQPLHRIQNRCYRLKASGAEVRLTAEHQYVILMDALAGLHYAHELCDYDGTGLGIVHRDVNPQNIFVTYDGQVKVVDFGIAKAARRSTETREGVIKGKIRYMAPEQALGAEVDRRADIFAVGVMLWEAAVGRRMWANKDDIDVVHAVVSNKLPPMPREVDPSVPEAIDLACRRALSPELSGRHATADELRTDIETYLLSTGKLHSLRREIPGIVGDLFKDKRAELRALIDRQLKTIDEAGDGLLAAVAPDTRSISSFDLRKKVPATVTVSDAAPADGTLAAPSPWRAEARSRVPPGNAWRLGALLGVAATLVAGIGVWASSGSKVAASSAAGVKPHLPMPSVPPSALPTPPSAPSLVAVRLAATPPHATIRIDEGPAQTQPVEVHLAPGPEPHRVHVQAEGYETHTESLLVEKDVAREFALQPSPKGGSRAAPPARSSGTARAQTGGAPSKREPSVEKAVASLPRGSGTTEGAAVSSTPPVDKSPPLAQPSPPSPSPRTNAAPEPRLQVDTNDPWGSK